MIGQKSILTTLALAAAALFFSGCDLVPLHMRDQAKYEPLEQSGFYADGLAARPVPANTIPRGEWGQIKLNEPFYTGQVEGEYVDTFPMTVTSDVLMRGQQRYEIFCSPCHSRVGDGQGMIVQRGFQQPPSFHIERLRNESNGYYYDVISNGFGAMYSYASRVPPEDRWAIIAYIRALQLSQNANFEELPETDRLELESLPEEEDNESN